MADHGTNARYATGCRCLDCRSAAVEYRRQRREKGIGPDDPRHGTDNAYRNLGCRCESCTAAWREYHHAWMHADPRRLERHALSERRRRAGGDR